MKIQIQCEEVVVKKIIGLSWTPPPQFYCKLLHQNQFLYRCTTYRAVIMMAICEILDTFSMKTMMTRKNIDGRI